MSISSNPLLALTPWGVIGRVGSVLYDHLKDQRCSAQRPTTKHRKDGNNNTVTRAISQMYGRPNCRDCDDMARDLQGGRGKGVVVNGSKANQAVALVCSTGHMLESPTREEYG